MLANRRRLPSLQHPPPDLVDCVAVGLHPAIVEWSIHPCDSQLNDTTAS
jgi:hypothetical protein